MAVETGERVGVDEPRSARDLAEAMRLASAGRRDNPPGDLLLELAAKRPDEGDQWVVLVPEITDLGTAIDEARGAGLWKLPPGTALRVRASSDPWWVGVMDDKREVRDAPPLPRGFLLAEDWVSAWEGEYADAEWMLEQCARVDQRAVVRACLACVRPHMEEINVRIGASPLDRRPKEALRWLDRWLGGAGNAGDTADVLAGMRTELRDLASDVRRSGRPTDDQIRESPRDALVTNAMIDRRYGVISALAGTCEVAIAAAATDVAWSASNVASDIAGVLWAKVRVERAAIAGFAGYDGRGKKNACRELAPVVRSVISVGEVMAARFRRGPKPWRAKGLR